jgi:pilus assembly protein CpaB
MSRRGRAAAFLVLALAAATIAAGIANGYGSRVARGYGALRPVVVVVADLAAGEPIGPERMSSALEVRRVPERFAPPDALAVPEEALGLVPAADLPAGSYLLAPQLRAPERSPASALGLGGSRRPVEISVSGAGALLAAGPLRSGARVDVVVTAEPDGVGPGRTYVAASRVPLIALEPELEGSGPSGIAAATLGLTKDQALRLIAAENFARQVTLLPGA